MAEAVQRSARASRATVSVRLVPVLNAGCMCCRRRVVVTDMDETLISKKSTGYIIKFLFMYRAYIRLFCFIWIGGLLIPLSKVSRSLAVRASALRGWNPVRRGSRSARSKPTARLRCLHAYICRTIHMHTHPHPHLFRRRLYFFAFRGLRVDRAERVAAEQLAELYVGDLQDPAASAVLTADDAVVLTASPDFLARPWLERFLRVAPENVYGATIGVRNGRYTGRLTDELPIGQKKARDPIPQPRPRPRPRSSHLIPSHPFSSLLIPSLLIPSGRAAQRVPRMHRTGRIPHGLRRPPDRRALPRGMRAWRARPPAAARAGGLVRPRARTPLQRVHPRAAR
jgi:phosphoserine phosphatase